MKNRILVALVLVGCGGGNDADPRLIAGGGIGDGAIDGKLNVYVVEAYTDEPVAGAEVRVGEPGETPLVGVTDSSGLYTFEADLAGPQTITAIADGYVVTTWFGANGANVTLPLDPEGTPAVAKSRLEGTIEGWADLPEPATDHLLLAAVEASDTTLLGDPQNDIEQPEIGGIPGNVCVKASAGTRCAWVLDARAGTIALHATIIDLDTKGTLDDADNTFEIIGYAFHLDTVVEAGVDQDGLVLEQAEATSLTDVTVTAADLPNGLDESAVALGLELPVQGILRLGLAQNTTGEIAVPVPDLTGAFAGGAYNAYAFANQPGTETGDRSAILRRGITELSAPIALGEWLGLASDLAVSGGTFSFTPVAGSPFHTVELFDGDGDAVWSVALIDGRTSFTLPGLDPSPLPADSVDMEVGGFVTGDLDLSDFSIIELWDVLERTSTARATLAL